MEIYPQESMIIIINYQLLLHVSLLDFCSKSDSKSTLAYKIT